MATRRKLKVFRTSAGFYDACVAAPSQKAALEAWGAEKNVFGMKAAELVTDPKLTKLALGRPGEVVRVLKGSPSDHLNAVGPTLREKKASSSGNLTVSEKAASSLKPTPRPSRRALDKAEEALAEFEKSAKSALADFRKKEERKCQGDARPHPVETRPVSRLGAGN